MDSSQRVSYSLSKNHKNNNIMSSGFGQWSSNSNSNKKGDEEEGGSSSWFGSSSVNGNGTTNNSSSEIMGNMSWTNMKAAMEAQMPQQIMGLGYQQRFQVFCGLLGLSALFFAMAFFVGVPLLVTRPQKFALSFTCGSLTFMASFGILKGPKQHLLSMMAPDRLVFTSVYIGSMLLTLYLTFTVGGLTGYVWVLLSSAAQLMALLYYLISFLPGGAAGLKYVTAVMAQVFQPVLVVLARAQALCLSRMLRWFVRSNVNAE